MNAQYNLTEISIGRAKRMLLRSEHFHVELSGDCQVLLARTQTIRYLVYVFCLSVSGYSVTLFGLLSCSGRITSGFLLSFHYSDRHSGTDAFRSLAEYGIIALANTMKDNYFISQRNKRCTFSLSGSLCSVLKFHGLA